VPGLKVNWYDADHALNVEAQQDRLDLLVRLLGPAA
jgi:hypothetical protein